MPRPQALTSIANATAAIALVPTISGAAFLLYPGKGIKQLGLTGSPTAKELGLLQMYACRQCAGGRSCLCLDVPRPHGGAADAL